MRKEKCSKTEPLVEWKYRNNTRLRWAFLKDLPAAGVATMEKSLSRAKAPQKNSTREREKQARETRSASERIWGFTWESQLPIAIEAQGVTFDLITFEEFQEFAAANFREAFDHTVDNEFTRGKNSEARNRYLNECADFFGVFGAGELLAVALGTPTDWTAYHVRNVTVKPGFHGNEFAVLAMRTIGDILRRFGVLKIEVYIPPTNQKSLNCGLKIGAVPIGYENSDQWGALVKLVIFLDSQKSETFLSSISAYSRSAHLAARPNKDSK